MMLHNLRVLNSNFMDALLERRSIRQYTGEKIPEVDIEKIIRSGFAAPTAVNKRETEFIVIDDKEVLNSIMSAHPYAKMLSSCSHAIAICADTTKAFTHDYWVCDASAACENILVATQALGYGGVWLGVYPEKDRMESLKRIFNLPPNHEVLAVVSLGIPKTKPATTDRYDAARVFRNTYHQ